MIKAFYIVNNQHKDTGEVFSVISSWESRKEVEENVKKWNKLAEKTEITSYRIVAVEEVWGRISGRLTI